MDKEKLTGLWAVAVSILAVILVGALASLIGGCGGTYTDNLTKPTICVDQVLSSEEVKNCDEDSRYCKNL